MNLTTETVSSPTSCMPPERPDQPVAPGTPRSARGFAALSLERRREISRLGGRAVHACGAAHEFTEEEARTAGRRGGEVVSQDRAHMARIGQLGGWKKHRNKTTTVCGTP